MRKYIFFIAAIFLVTCTTIKKYSNLPEVQRWETEIQKFEALDQTESYPDNSIIFAGSSSIVLWKTIHEDMAPYPVIHRGYGGSRLSDFAVYADRIIYPHKNNGIVLFIANDIAGNENDKTPKEVLWLFKNVIKTIRKKYPDTPVFWISITPTERRWNSWPQIKEVNRLIKNYCLKSKNLHFIDTELSFLNEEGRPKAELFATDKLHLSPEGYKLWTSIIKSELDKILK